MTLPTRPAPAPPGSRAQNAAANANASLEQLRLQLQQQQQLQRSQHNVTVPKLTIKLPPPPKQPVASNAHSNGAFNNNTGSITRKFPQARYAPATNWDDSPFDILTGGGVSSSKPQTQATTNGNYKKQPPARPPPPKVLPKKGAAHTPTPAQHSANILTNIFHLKKKSSKAATPSNASSRIYGSAAYGTTTSTTSTRTLTTLQTNGFSTSNSLSTDWNSAWNTTSNSNSISTSVQQTSQQTVTSEAQLISFDSPPSSPTFTQKSNSDCVSVDSFSSDSNFSSPNNGSVSQPESGFEDDFSTRSRPATTSPLDPWQALDAFGNPDATAASTTTIQPRYGSIGTAPVRNLSTINTRIQTNSDNPLCNGKSLLPPAPTLNMPTIIKPKISQKPKAPKPPLLAKPLTTFGSSSIYSDNLITPPSPPMPQCAPPPPPPTTAITSSSSFAASSSTSSSTTQKPSILDVITGKIDAIELSSGTESYNNVPMEPPHGIALYDFDSTEEGDLSFRENEKIYLLEQVSAEWYKGRTRSGCEGIFPINYIDIKVPLPSSTGSSESSTQSSSASITPTYQTTTTASSNNLTVRCLYNFPAEVEGDLELKENDLVTILYRINEDWLYGEVNGRQGQFPANFLEHVPSNIPMP